MALDEPNQSYRQYTSNNIDVQIHPDLDEQLKPLGGVAIDYVDNGPQQKGFTIRTVSRPEGEGCSGCNSAESGCGEEK